MKESNFFQKKDNNIETKTNKISQITKKLSSVDFINMWSIPSDSDYQELENALFQPLEVLQVELESLKKIITSKSTSLFGLMKYLENIRTVLNLSQEKNNSENININPETQQVIKDFFTEISDLPDVPYILTKYLDPEYLHKPFQPFEKWMNKLTVVDIDSVYSTVDTGENFFYILKIPQDEKEKLKASVDSYKAFMEETLLKPKPVNDYEEMGKDIATKAKNNVDLRWALPEEFKEFLVPFHEYPKFFPHTNNDLTGYRDDEMVFEARSFLKPEIRSAINEDLKINLETATFQEQMYFLTYIAKKNNHEMDSIRNFTHKFGDVGLKTFLSLSHGGRGMGQKILDIGEKLTTESANHVFAKYTELVDATEDLATFIRDEFIDIEISSNKMVLDDVRKNILKKGIDVLNTLSHHLDSSISKEDIDTISLSVTDAISRISTDTLVTLSTFKHARKHGYGVSLEDINSSNLHAVAGLNVSSSERDQMFNIYKQNYNDKPELASMLTSKMKDSFTQANSQYYIYDINKEVKAFIRFQDVKGGKKASALNVDPDTKGYSIGSAMMEQALEKESQNNVLYAEACMDDFPLSKYLEMGFVVTGKNNDYSNLNIVDITWDRDYNKKLISRKLTVAEIFNMISVEGVLIKEIDAIEDFDHRDLADYIITRKVVHPETKKIYLVLEEKK